MLRKQKISLPATRFSLNNKGFTAIEFVIYIGVVSLVFLLTLAIFYAIIFYSGEYYDKILLRNEGYKIIQKIYYNNTYAQGVEVTTSSLKFVFADGSYEKIFATSGTIYLENQTTSSRWLSDMVRLLNFDLATSGKFINIFVRLENNKKTQQLPLKLTIYLWKL